MLDLDGLDGVRADEAAPRAMEPPRAGAAPRAAEAPRAERVRVITPPPLPDDAPPGADAAPSDAELVAPEQLLAPPVPSLAPRTPWLLLAVPVAVLAVVAMAWMIGVRTQPAPIIAAIPAPASAPTPASRPIVASRSVVASRPVVTPLPSPIDAILPARFGFNERTPSGEARQIAAVVARCGNGPVVLTGHADAVGTARANDEIALARADAVRALLVAGGVDATRVRIVSAGATQPIASNASARGRRDNRRVTLHCEPHNGGEP